jgi:uncharacterized membrane protein YqhA
VSSSAIVRYLLPLRFLMLFASVGALLGAGIMFWLAGEKLTRGAEVLSASGSVAAAEITAAVMGATDALLFGVVLIIFAYAIAFGFVLQLKGAARETLPGWMHVQGVSELKQTLVEVIIVYLVVDFATDMAAGAVTLTWQILVKPASILLIAVALRLLRAPRGGSPAPGHL